VHTAETFKLIKKILTCWLLLKMFVAKSNPLFFYDRGVKHTASGPKPARCEVESGPPDDFVK